MKRGQVYIEQPVFSLLLGGNVMRLHTAGAAPQESDSNWERSCCAAYQETNRSGKLSSRQLQTL